MHTSSFLFVLSLVRHLVFWHCIRKKKAVDDKEVIDPHTILSEEEIKDLKGIFELFDEDRRSEIRKDLPAFCSFVCWRRAR